MNDSQRTKGIDRAQLKVIFQVPFFAPGVARLPVHWVDGVPTACTDGKAIKWSREFYDGLPEPVRPTVLCHEALHCEFGHVWRAPAGCDWDLWNQACDHEINLLLKEFSAQRMAQGLADPFPFPEPADAYCADPAFVGMAAEQIYARLAAARSPGGGRGGKQGQSGGGSSQSSSQGKSDPNSGKGQPRPNPGSMPAFGQMEQPDPAKQDPAAQKALATDWQNTLMQSAMVAKGRGELPGSLERLINEHVNPTVHWTEIVASWLREQCSDDWDWLTPAMEYSGADFILPSLHSEKVGEVVFAVDTSGSTADLIPEFLGNVQGALDQLRPRKLVNIFCDTAIQRVDEYAPGDTVSRDIPGGGGTDLRKVFDYVEEQNMAPRCLVILTDLDTPFPPADPGYQVLWVVRGGGKAPFGEVIEVKE
jgi:predicted metal-dependent peptidase